MAIADQPLLLDLGDDGPTVWLEAVPAIVRESGSAMTPSKHAQRIESVTTRVISDVVKSVARKLRDDLADDEPEKINLSFAISVDTSGRVLIGASGTVRVQIEWRKGSTSPATE
jgi:hypothetical protein